MEPQKTLSIEEAVGTGWQNFLGNMMLMVSALVMGALVSGPGMAVNITHTVLELASKDQAKEAQMGVAMLFMVLGLGTWAWQTFMQPFIHAGWIKMVLGVANGQGVSIGDLFSCLPRWWAFFASTFLYGLMVGFGVCLLIAPGVFLAISFGFYRFFVIEHNMGPLAALEASWNLTSGSRMQLFLLGLVCLAIGFGGFLCLIIGSLPAFVITELIWANAYQQLMRQQGQGR